ncbi:murein L,D-transpeptidase catalytic domain family protein [Niastella caeni]|uniref:Murein L,D-transpeptidase catalytic domain family protein n=2 Tax=Niastella caeni TaxID=2569763 RepID=A0A4S8HR34_9BACT|nr:murein L,D-transpeptidase catalytic domain family protein [Niastella caeni]
MSFGALLCILAVSPVNSTGTGNEAKEIGVVNASTALVVRDTATTKEITKSAAAMLAEEALDLYNVMNLKKVGLSIKAFEYALKGYKNLVECGKVMKNEVLSICDFSQSSRRKRFYVIDMAEKKVLINTWVAHGRNSGGEYARSFSNSPESHKSSLGFYVTRYTYYGSHGLALKIEGLEKSFNDKADERNIVIHGSNYVGDNFLSRSPINGRSFGCPALPQKETGKVIETIKDGSCLFIYHPSKNYIQKSKVLNG